MAHHDQEKSRWHTRVEVALVHPLTEAASTLMRATVWIVFVSGYALSALVFAHWAYHSFSVLLLEQHSSAKEVIHVLLLSIELLILVPVPAIIGLVIYRTLVQVSDTHRQDLTASKQQVQLAEQLLIGLLVTVTGTTMLDSLILGEGEWRHYGGGAAIIGALSLFFYLAKK